MKPLRTPTKAVEEWNAVTRQIEFDYGRAYREFVTDDDWFHNAENYIYFYHLGMADPTNREMMRRARRFAGFYTGEDPEAPNYDPEYKILRSPFQSSQGPRQEADVEFVHAMLLAGRWLGGDVNYYGVRASLYPIVEDLELDWWVDDKR